MSGLIARRGMMVGAGGKGHNLPPEYQEVEWISNPYGTNIKFPNPFTMQGWGIKAKFQVPNNRATYQCCIKGTVTGQADVTYFGVAGNPRKQQIMATRSYVRSLNEYAEQVITVAVNYKNDGLCTIDGEQAESVPSLPSISNVDDFSIFGYKTYGGCPPVYELELTVGNEVVMDFIPCYRKSDGARGFYDVKGTIYEPTNSPLYSNESGDKRYTLGPEV